MTKFLANENVPQSAVTSAREMGIDLAWIKEIVPGATDEEVLARSMNEKRVLVTFDKDFGELAFRQGKAASCGVVLLRPRLRSPEFLSRFVVAVLTQPIEWENQFSVAHETAIRVVPLP